MGTNPRLAYIWGIITKKPLAYMCWKLWLPIKVEATREFLLVMPFLAGSDVIVFSIINFFPVIVFLTRHNNILEESIGSLIVEFE